MTSIGLVDARFLKDQSYFPVEGELDDPFNHSFKIRYEVSTKDWYATFPVGSILFGVRWKGNSYIIRANDSPISILPEEPITLTFDWSYLSKPPTISQFIQSMGEQLPEKTTIYDYSWIVGFSIDKSGNIVSYSEGGIFYVKDEWRTALMVKIPSPGIKIGTNILPWIGIIIAGLGVVGLARRTEIGTRIRRARTRIGRAITSRI